MQFGGDSRTRDRVMRVILTRGPVTAADVAAELGLTPAGVRRHLDVMTATGLVTERETTGTRPRGPGRPARAYVLTTEGHSALDGGYDELAVSAIDFLARTQGREAVEAFAAHRSAELERRYAPDVAAAGTDPGARATALAAALSGDGYAASTRAVDGGTGVRAVQLCQGHCPVQHAAAEFPELCEAETRAFSRLLGTHVRRLATLASGAHVCTTHVPVAAATGSSTYGPRHDATSRTGATRNDMTTSGRATP